MGLLLQLFGPTLMIFLGLQVMNNVPLTFILFYGWLVIVPLIEIMQKGYNLRETLKWLGLKYERNSLIFGLYTGILSFVFIFWGISLSQYYFFDISYLKKLLITWDFSGHYLVFLILILSLVNPFLEEIYWRGFMFQKLQVERGAIQTIIITSAFYSLYHLLSLVPMFKWPINIIGIIPVFFAGFMWAYLRFKFNTLSGPILSHLLSDCGIIAVYFKFLS